MSTKICTKCNQTKELSEFSKKEASKDGLRGSCKACDKLYREDNKERMAATQKQWNIDNKERIKQYQQDNAERIAEYNKQWREENKEHCAEYSKKYAQDNKDQIAEYKKQWHKDNPQYDKQYRQDNADHRAEYNKQWRQTPKGKAARKASSHNRRAQKLNNGGNHTGAELLNLFDLQSGKCPYCKVKLNKTGNNKYHSDHVLPLSKGGTNDISNIQLLCPKCNMSKHDKLPEEFAANFNKLF